jgi:hypothetical protein
MKVRIVADDLAEEKGFKSKYVGKIVEIVGYKPNPNRPDGTLPIYRDQEGKEFSGKNLWHEEIVEQDCVC